MTECDEYPSSIGDSITTTTESTCTPSNNQHINCLVLSSLINTNVAHDQ